MNRASPISSPTALSSEWQRPAVTMSCLVALFVISPLRAQLTTATEPSRSISDKPADYKDSIPGSDVTFEMVGIAGGTFSMGSPESEIGRQADEGPLVKVTVPAFWIGKHEVTWSEYRQFMRLSTIFDQFNDQGIRPVTKENETIVVTAPSKLYDPSFTYETGDDPRQPAISMSQYAAKQYTKWLSLLTGEFYRLPTEAEWEYACRAGSTTAFGFGDAEAELSKYGWFTENSDYATGVVGTKQPNAWGVYDMHGNVAEWVLDAYKVDHYQTAVDQPVSANQFVAWPKKLFPRVLRGGSWDSEAVECRSAARGQSNDEELRSYDPNVPKSPWWFASDEAQSIGFRIVRPLRPPSSAEREAFWDADIDSIRRDVQRRIDEEGRGERGVVDGDLPAASKALRQK